MHWFTLFVLTVDAQTLAGVSKTGAKQSKAVCMSAPIMKRSCRESSLTSSTTARVQAACTFSKDLSGFCVFLRFSFGGNEGIRCCTSEVMFSLRKEAMAEELEELSAIPNGQHDRILLESESEDSELQFSECKSVIGI